MKQVYGLVFALFLVNGAMGQWFPQNSGTTNTLNSVYFTDAYTGYAVGESGSILKTADGGLNWTSQTSGISDPLQSVCFIDPNIGYAVGGYVPGKILKTIDGGLHWTSKDAPWPLNSVYFTDADTGYAVGGDMWYYGLQFCLIMKTTDGGMNWNTIFTDSSYKLRSVFFTDAWTGYAVGHYGRILRTSNGGNDWITQFTDTTITFTSVFFPNADTGYALGIKYDLWSGGSSVILKTMNGGADWSATVLEQIDGLRLISLFFTSGITGYAVGNCCFEGIETVYTTTNGGLNWTFEDYSIGGLNSVFFPDVDTGYSVGIGGVILKTTNGGVGIHDEHQKTRNLTLYPTPACTAITIETPIKGSLSILTISGQQLMQQTITEPKTTIDVSSLPGGVYIVRVAGENGVQVGKVLKL